MLEESYRQGCLVCGKELKYLDSEREVNCFFCNEAFPSTVVCLENHYVCDKCHSLEAVDFIENTCIRSDSVSPIELAIKIMKHPSVKMHGPEHHFLVPAVLLTAVYNKIDSKDLKKEALKKARNRSQNISGGFCGYYGTCGAGIGIGIFVSVFTDATPVSKKEWKLANTATGITLLKIAERGGPRCCKRNTFTVLEEGIKFIKSKFKIELKKEKTICEFYAMNRECLKSDCPYY